MNNGSFFRLDLETSKVVEGITFYEYIDLPELETKVDGLRYPIRLTISQDRVSIFVHYYDDSKDSVLPHHTEEIILDLPYKNSGNEALSSIIKRIYNTDFPISDYLQKIMGLRYDNHKREEYEEELKKEGAQGIKEREIEEELKIIERYNNLQKSPINKDSYSSLLIWDLLDREKRKGNKYTYQLRDEINKNNNKEKPKIKKFLRKLLLDFMFDLMHSDVFECSKYYSEMRDGLMSDFFFSSIIKKSEYYYQRRLIRNKLQSTIENSSEWSSLLRCIKNKTEKNNSPEYNTINAIKNLYAEKLDEAEKEWIDAIMSPMADKHFHFSPEWYEDQISSKKKDGVFSLSESWFVNPEEEMERVVFPLPEIDLNSKQHRSKRGFSFWRTENNSTVHYLNSYELSNLIGTKDDSSLAERTTKISKWFYRRFDFKDTFRLHLFNRGHLLFFFILTLFAVGLIASTVVSSFGIFENFSELLWESPKYFAIFPAIAAAAFIVITIIFLIQLLWAKPAKKIDDFFVKQRLRRELKRTILLFLCFASISAFLFYFDNYIFQLFILIGIIILLLLCFSFSRRNRIINNIHLLLPRLVASITTGWIMLVIGNDIFQEHLPWLVRPIIVVIVFTFILYENNKTLPNISTGTRIWRAIQLMLIGYSISLIVGLFAMDILEDPSIKDTLCICQEQQSLVVSHPWNFFNDKKELTLTVFPEQLVQFSFLAMFIGVFIQMIFEEKNITEM